MRVYEFSKQVNISNKELLKILQEGGFGVATHMAALSDEALEYLKKKFSKDKPSSIETSSIKEAPVEQPRKKADMQEAQKVAQDAKKITPILEIKPMSLGAAADLMGLPASELILVLLKQGVVCTKNQLLSEKIIEQLAQQFGFETVLAPTAKPQAATLAKETSAGHSRLPVVVVMGHVDHGKTSLLDFIRKTRVAAREKGGITQHIGAYQANTAHGDIVFLDTPGHEAFSKLRMRGVTVADIAVLVIAADDGPMPQTIEAISHAQAANLPIIVAINKIDKVDPARIEVVKRSLAQYNLLPEQWGGQTIFVPISAKTGAGVDQLLEMINLQAEIMELKAHTDVPAAGFVLESKQEKGLGAIATIITQKGTLRIGDLFSAGTTFGRVTLIIDSNGKRLTQVGPSTPVFIAGFDELPQAGDLFTVVGAQEYAHIKAQKGVMRMAQAPRVAQADSVSLIIKADSDSSREVLLSSIEKISSKGGKVFRVIHAGIGPINESDITLGSSTGSIVYGFHVKMDSKAVALTHTVPVSVRLFDIIYKLLDDLMLLIKADEKVPMVTVKIGQAVVRKVFDIKGVGVIAGCYVQDGRFNRDGLAVIFRGNKKIAQGKIKSLQRDKKAVKEVNAGYECAFLVDGFTEWIVDDRIDCMVEQPVSAKIKAE